MKLTYLHTDDLAIIGNSPILYIDSLKTIVLGDLHLGQQEAILKSQNKFNSENIKEILQYLKPLTEKLEIRRIILNGDIKHNTSRFSSQERKELETLFSTDLFLSSEVILIIGNHDVVLKLGIKDLIRPHWKIQKSFECNGYLIFHGDTKPEIGEKTHTIIISHEHPSANISDNIGHSIRAKAFVELDIIDKEKRIKCIIIPASGYYTIGVKFPIKKKSDFISPLLKSAAMTETQVLYVFTKEIGPYKLLKT